MNIIITGASGGIGADLALQIACEENHSLLLISRNTLKLKDVEDKIRAINNKCKCFLIPADLSSVNEIKRISVLIRQKFKHIDILINNAGMLANKPFEHTSKLEIEEMINVNLLAPVYLIQELLPLLKNADNAHVINIGSMGGTQGSSKFPGLSFYSASKGGLAILTECLAEEYKNTTVRFNYLALGSADTDMFREAFPGFTASLSPTEMAGFIKFFAFSGYKYFNGKILPVALTSP